MRRVSLSLAAALVCSAGACFASGSAHWGYVGATGPDHWGSLNPAYEMCAKGVNQSPVNLTGFVEAELEPIDFHYTGLATEVVNNGHTIQANYTAGSTIKTAGTVFELKQFHFHSPSENTIDGIYYPLEGHFVHVADDGAIAVVSVMYKIGAENEALARLWKQMPQAAGEKEAMAAQVRAQDLMPEDRDYYRFNGSLTTPPCTEGVLWLVMKEPVEVSTEQVEQFFHTMHHANNRPVQPIGARAVLK